MNLMRTIKSTIGSAKFIIYEKLLSEITRNTYIDYIGSLCMKQQWGSPVIFKTENTC